MCSHFGLRRLRCLLSPQKRALHAQRHHWASKKYDKLTDQIRDVGESIASLQADRVPLVTRQHRTAGDISSWGD
eukprot:9496674-Pyramimonas_sp.AAC.1